MTGSAVLGRSPGVGELFAALGGWAAATMVALVAAVVWRMLWARVEDVARACHELRGPLAAARLGLQLGARVGELSPARLRAIDLELGRAALALEDLGCARGLLARRPLAGRGPLGRRAPLGRSGWPSTTRPRAPRPPVHVDMWELLTDSVEAWRATALARGVELRSQLCDGAALVLGDRLRIAQATGNLICNAIEHGGGVVEVRGRIEGNRIRIEVVDTGPGLPAPVAELARRAHRGRGERGRGLAIATAIAEHHGGRLAAAPSERGARLVLELPAARPRATTASARPGPEPGPTPLKRDTTPAPGPDRDAGGPG